jgi:hypothetical protein
VLNISPYAATFGGLTGLHSLPTVLIGLIGAFTAYDWWWVALLASLA